MARRFYKQLKSSGLSGVVAEGAVLIDIRRPEEWELTGVIEGSQLLTFFAQDGSSDPACWLQQFEQLVTADQPVVLICRSGYRTSLISEFLIETTSWTNIYNLTEGILGWLSAGFPVVRPEAERKIPA